MRLKNVPFWLRHPLVGSVLCWGGCQPWPWPTCRLPADPWSSGHHLDFIQKFGLFTKLPLNPVSKVPLPRPPAKIWALITSSEAPVSKRLEIFELKNQIEARLTIVLRRHPRHQFRQLWIAARPVRVSPWAPSSWTPASSNGGRLFVGFGRFCGTF